MSIRKLGWLMFAFLCLLSLGIHDGWPTQKRIDPFPNVKIPIFPQTRDEKVKIDIFLRSKTLKYEVAQIYPADKILKYYNDEMEREGFKGRYDIKGINRRWVEYLDGSQDEIKKIKQYSSAWTSKNNKVLIILLLRYESALEKEESNNLKISIQIRDNINYEAYNMLLEDLAKSGTLEQFNELIQKYARPNQSFEEFIRSLEKGISENPENKYLQRYLEIIKRDKNVE